MPGWLRRPTPPTLRGRASTRTRARPRPTRSAGRAPGGGVCRGGASSRPRRGAIVGFPGVRTLRALSRGLRGKPLGPRRTLEDFVRELAASGWTLRRATTVAPLLAETTLVLAERTPAIGPAS